MKSKKPSNHAQAHVDDPSEHIHSMETSGTVHGKHLSGCCHVVTILVCHVGQWCGKMKCKPPNASCYEDDPRRVRSEQMLLSSSVATNFLTGSQFALLSPLRARWRWETLLSPTHSALWIIATDCRHDIDKKQNTSVIIRSPLQGGGHSR